jgi:gliding motility-associated lipoprotein GldD
MRTRLYHMIPMLVMFLIFACHPTHTPKPRGFLRIDFPAKEYVLYDSVCPYTFEYPSYGKIVADTDYNTEPCWINIDFPDFDGKIHISYKEVNQNLNDFIEDSRSLTYKHTIKADAIKETVYTNPELDVYGILYDIKGNAASSIQFYLTDSNAHFLRGALYFNVPPDRDSLAPVISFFREDIIHLVESFAWK